MELRVVQIPESASGPCSCGNCMVLAPGALSQSGYGSTMQFTRPKILASLATLCSGVAIALTILDAGPNVMHKYGHLLPQWFQDPKAIGVCVTALVTALVIALILAPWKRAPHNSQSFNTIGGWIVIEMQSCLRHIRSAAKIGGIDAVNKEILAALDHGIPTFLESAMSMSARRVSRAGRTRWRTDGTASLVLSRHELFGRHDRKGGDNSQRQSTGSQNRGTGAKPAARMTA